MGSRITKRAVDALQPGEIAWDADMQGFGARCLPSGRKVYVLKYRAGKGRAARQRWFTIGRHGAPHTPESARTEARKLLGAVASGEDPQAVRELDLRAVTIAAFSKRYLDDAANGLVTYRGRPKRASTLAVDVGRVERHIKPLVGHLKVKDVDRAAIERMMRDVAAGRTKAEVKTGPRGKARVTGGKTAASRVVGLMGSILSYAVKLGIRADNPVRGLERFADGKRDRHLRADELNRLARAIDVYEAGGGNPKAADVARVIALTACRKEEVAALRRPEIDLEGSCLRLGIAAGDERTKTGKSIRPLGKPAKALLKRLLSQANGHRALIFPDENENGTYKGFGKEFRKIRELAGLGPDVIPHTLRHTFASVAANEFEYSDSTIDALLGHGSGNWYVHRVDAPLLAAADKVSQWIDRAMRGEPTNPPSSTL